MDNKFEQIIPWNGAQDTGRDVRLKWQRNFERIKSNFEEISELLKGTSLEELQKIFLRKDAPDSTRFLLSLFGGAIFGKDGFASGLTGFGAKIDEYGYGEMEGLFLRRFLEVPELRYNRVSVTMGDTWNAPGAGILESVTIDTDADGNPLMTGTGVLKLEDGEFGAVAVGDICMGIFHSTVASENATANSDDSRGNRQFAGFYTTYFTVTEVSSDTKTFRYQLRPVSDRWKLTKHPCEAMHFVAYGNFTNEDRQTSTYSTRDYTRRLWKQNTWEISAANIAMQIGNLMNLNVHGMNMVGYSAYLNSVYFTGTIMQTKPDGTPVRTANDRGAWETGHYDYYDRVSHNGCIWLCVNEDGTDSEPAEGNPDWLLQVRKGDDGEPGPQGVPGTDGKDGKTYYTWIRYADDAQGTGISNNPTGKEYIGFAYNKETATESNNPLDYTWSLIKGEKGDDGTSLVNMGGWYTGLFVPYMGIVRMGGASWQCINKNGTSNPPLWTITDKDNNRLLQTQDSGKTYGYILTGEENTAEYVLVARDGTDGAEGVPGMPGKDGKTLFTWIRYADDAQGTGISDHPSGKAFIGFAYNKESSLESNNPEDYTWSDIKGEQGVPGEKGADGTQYYTWIAYSDNADGSGMYQQPKDSTLYIGIAVNKTTATESTNPADYTWSRFKGEKGEKGDQGIPGPKGEDGTQYWTWVAYSDNADGSNMYQVPNEDTKYIGIAVNKLTQTESSDPADYTWSKFKGEDGAGISNLGNWYTGLFVPYLGIVRMGYGSYMCINKNGTSNPPLWTITDKGGNRLLQTQDGGNTYGYILTGEMNTAEYVLVAADGADGVNGVDGIQGPKGEDGRTTYFHVKYSANPDGNPMSETPSVYIGTYVDYTEEDSDDYTKYTWSRFQGLQGEQGIPGKDGASGITYYWHIKYSNDGGATFTANNGETPGKFMGTLVDTNPTDSSTPSAYKWAEIKGDKGDKGDQGDKGDKGDKGEDGTSVSHHGDWKTGKFIPYMGIVRMGGSSWICINANGTSNPPCWTITDSAGNRLLQTQDGGRTYGYILTGENNTAEYDLVAEDGKPGADGKPGDKGEQGLQGCILRRSEWKTGTEYRNDEALTSGTRYLDVALVQDNNAATGWRAYKCRQTHTSSSANAPGTSGGNTYWEEFGINTTAIFTSLIIAKDALINFMSGNQLLIRKDDGTVTIGLTGGYNNKAYIWAGGTTPDNARFRVDELGKAVMTDSEVHGTIYAISGQIGGFTIVGNSLQNTGDGYITITNGKRMAGIGGGLAGILGYDAAGVFRNEETYSLPAGTVNIAAYLSASGAQYNFAFQGRGNGVLSGIMEGYALNYVDNTSANVTDLTRGKYIEMNTPSGNVAHVLPRKTHVEGVLGVSSTTAFAVLLHYFGKYESGGFFTLYGRTTSVSGANTAEFPYLYDHNGNNVSVQIAKGDSAEVLLVYDGAQYFAQLLNVRN